MPPVGFKRSRALWDQTRLIPHGDERNNNNYNKLDYYKALGRAILYELQPVRGMSAFVLFSQEHLWLFKVRVQAQVQKLVRETTTALVETAPVVAKQTVVFCQQRTWQQYMLVAALFVYYWVVRWVHEWLHAGPVMVIATVLCIICTVGLGDTAGTGLSAYSVFNRGVRLLGDIQAEDLLAQHVGGMMMMMGANDNDDDDIDDDDNDHVLAAAAARRPPPRPDARRRAALENNNDNDAAAVANNREVVIHQEPQQAPAAAVAQQNQQQQPQPPRGRLAGKKARRRNLEQRREMRRQREAAAAMGFGGGGGDNDNDDLNLDDFENEQNAALQHILQEQIRLQQQQHG